MILVIEVIGQWALVTVSLFNSLLLLWLGLTVFLTAEHRTGGLWLILTGIALGALFFVSHTILLTGRFVLISGVSANFWWHVGWVPVILTPLLWYLVMLWYSGFWEHSQASLHRRHRQKLLAMVIFAVSMFPLAVTGGLPIYEHITILYLAGSTGIGGVPLMLIIYPIFAILCLVLSIDVLQHPEPSRRMMGDLARERSRPWLIGTSAVLLVALLLVTLFIIVVVYCAFEQVDFVRTSTFFRMIALFDFAIASSIAAGILLLGQAIVSYEVFTGKTLPRRGFVRHWHNAILLAGGLSAFIGLSLMVRPPLIFSLLMMAVLAVVFYALLSWRSFVHRDDLIAQMRPFVDSPALMQQLITADDEAHSRAQALFSTICRDVLNTQHACLIPLGVLAPLAGGPITYPEGAVNGTPELASGLFPRADVVIAPLDPAKFDGYHWAIPLWAERGLIGAVLLGDKPDGGLYAQEEIDIARTSAERIVDMRAGEQMARRLVKLQRKRHTETRVVDLKTRRTLHDEVLPALHTAVLQVNRLAADNPSLQETIQTLTSAHQQISKLIHTTLDEPRALPISHNLAAAVRQMVDAEFDGVFQDVTWQLADNLPQVDDLSLEVLLHAIREAIRNAAIHGRGNDPKRTLCLTVIGGCDDALTFRIIDNGVGIADHTRGGERSGGLALHSTMLAIVGGFLLAEAGADEGTSVTISLPVLPHP